MAGFGGKQAPPFGKKGGKSSKGTGMKAVMADHFKSGKFGKKKGKKPAFGKKY